LWRLIIIGREIAISALREWMAQIGASKSVAVHMIGKLKTVVQMVAIPFLLFDGHVVRAYRHSRYGVSGVIWIAAVLTVMVHGVLPAKGPSGNSCPRPIELTRLPFCQPVSA